MSRSFLFSVAVLLSAPAAADIFDVFGGDKLTDGSRYAFVPSKVDKSIIAIDAVDRDVAATIEIPHIAGGVVATNELDLLIATNPQGQSATVISLYDQEIVATLELGMRPDTVIPNAYDRFVTFGSEDGSVSTWDLASKQQVLRVDGLDSATSLTFSFDGSHLFVVESALKRISVIDMAKHQKIAEIPLGGDADPNADVSTMSRSADGFTGYLSISSENRVVVIDLVKWEAIQSIPVGRYPLRPFSTSDNRLVLIPNTGDQTLSVIAARTRNVVATVATGVTAREVNTGWLDTVAFVMPAAGDTIGVVDLQTFRTMPPIKLPGRTDNGLVTSDSKILLTAVIEKGQVAIVDAQAGELGALVDTGTSRLEGIEIALSNNVCH